MNTILAAAAWNDDEKGGWLLYQLHDVFMQKIRLGEKFNLIQALNEVSGRVAQECVAQNSFKCVPVVEHKLIQDIFIKVSE